MIQPAAPEPQHDPPGHPKLPVNPFRTPVGDPPSLPEERREPPGPPPAPAGEPPPAHEPEDPPQQPPVGDPPRSDRAGFYSDGPNH